MDLSDLKNYTKRVTCAQSLFLCLTIVLCLLQLLLFRIALVVMKQFEAARFFPFVCMRNILSKACAVSVSSMYTVDTSIQWISHHPVDRIYCLQYILSAGWHLIRWVER